MNLKTVHWEPDEIPLISQWNELKQILKEHRAAYMLWVGKPVPESIDRLKAEGMASITFDPCANRPEQGDFMSTMKANVESLMQAYQ